MGSPPNQWKSTSQFSAVPPLGDPSTHSEFEGHCASEIRSMHHHFQDLSIQSKRVHPLKLMELIKSKKEYFLHFFRQSAGNLELQEKCINALKHMIYSIK